ncbi:hypothetical protein V6N13_005261 [Hibiscus sabdariffa]
MRCSTPLPPSADQRFTIHGLWPQDAMDDPVDPNTSTHSCIPKPPIDLDKEWPDLKNPLVTSVNMKFLESELKKHETYSDFAHDPFNYFNSALQIRASLPDFGIRSGASYKVEEVIELVKGLTQSHLEHFRDHATGLTGVEPEIACNVNSNNKDVQLWEIRLCNHKPDP